MIMCLLAHTCGAWGQQQAQPAQAAPEAEAAACSAADSLYHESSSSSSVAGVGTPSGVASTPTKCVSNSSSLLTDDSAAAAASAAGQRDASLASRLQQLMNAWAWDGGGGGSSAQPSPGGSPQKQPQQQSQQQQQYHHLLPVSSIGVPDSPLSEDTLSSLLGAFHLEAADPLRSIDPDNLVSVVSGLSGHTTADTCCIPACWLCHCRHATLQDNTTHPMRALGLPAHLGPSRPAAGVGAAAPLGTVPVCGCRAH